MRSLLILIIALLSLIVASQEWATQPSEMGEASTQASRPYRVKVTSPHPFSRQIGPPLSRKRVITPVPKESEPETQFTKVSKIWCSKHPTSSCSILMANKATYKTENMEIAGDDAGERTFSLLTANGLRHRYITNTLRTSYINQDPNDHYSLQEYEVIDSKNEGALKQLWRHQNDILIT